MRRRFDDDGIDDCSTCSEEWAVSGHGWLIGRIGLSAFIVSNCTFLCLQYTQSPLYPEKEGASQKRLALSLVSSR